MLTYRQSQQVMSNERKKYHPRASINHLNQNINWQFKMNNEKGKKSQ